MAKKYFWLKLKDDFFQDKRIKKLRRIAGGDTYTVIYLKMQLLSLKNEGILFYEGVEDSFFQEIALEIDEDEDNVKFTIMFLQSNGLLEEVNENSFALIETMNSIGSETQGAERVRRFRDKQKVLHCNAPVTNGNTEIDIDIDKDIDKEIETDKDKKSSSVALIDENFINIKNHFEQLVRIATVQDCHLINEALEFYEPQLIIQAMQAGKSSARSFKYILSILDNWRKELGVKTYSDWQQKIEAKEAQANAKHQRSNASHTPKTQAESDILQLAATYTSDISKYENL